MTQLVDYKKNRAKRKQKDAIANFFTYLSAFLASLVLASIFLFVFTRGLKVLNWEMIKNDYWSLNLVAKSEEPAGSFSKPEGLPENAFFSEKYGIAVMDSINQHKAKLIRVVYQDAESPITKALVQTKGDKFEQAVGDIIGSDLTRVTVMVNGERVTVGSQAKTEAQTFIETLDKSESISQFFYQSAGGGIRGSLEATLLLILVSLLISIPIGIAAAVYLHEYAKPNKLTGLMRSSIEMLSGVPSIIFGLMGVAVLFPITSLFGAHTLSILLGGITMSVMLLPIVIRQTEESLIVVPDGLRNASLSLGATETQTIFKVVLPTALPGIISAVLLAVSRVIGESAALIYTMGTAISDNPKLLQGATSLAVSIWSIMSGEQPNFELASAISIIILVVVLGLNIIVKIISNRLNRKWEV